MVGVKISIDGRRKNFARDESEYMLEEAAAEIEDMAKSNAPVKTGNLVNSISTESLTSRSAFVNTDCDYAIFQEEGTSRGVPAQHFMKNAMNSVKSKYSGYLTFSYEK